MQTTPTRILSLSNSIKFEHQPLATIIVSLSVSGQNEDEKERKTQQQSTVPEKEKERDGLFSPVSCLTHSHQPAGNERARKAIQKYSSSHTQQEKRSSCDYLRARLATLVVVLKQVNTMHASSRPCQLSSSCLP